MVLTDILAIVDAALDGLTTLGVLPYVLAGAVIGLIGRAIVAAKKASR
jgi:hypothetical protein